MRRLATTTRNIFVAISTVFCAPVYAATLLDHDYAYIDKSGQIVLSGPFVNTGEYQGGVTVADVKSFELKDGNWFIPKESFKSHRETFDIQGNIIDTLESAPIQGFLDEFAILPVKGTKGEFSIVDKTWQERSRIKASMLGPYSQGLIAYFDTTAHKWGYLDINGKTVIKPQFQVTNPFSEGVALVGFSGPKLFNGYINKDGKLVLKIQYRFAGNFHNGLAWVSDGNKWGYIDTKGNTVIPLQYDLALDFSSTEKGLLAPVRRDNKFGFINNKNEVAIDFKYILASPFSENLAAVAIDQNKSCFIDCDGNVVIKPNFKRTFAFNNGRAKVHVAPRDDFGKRKEDAQYLFLTGKRALLDHDVDKATAAFNSAIKLAPGTPPARKSRYFLEAAVPTKPVAQDVIKMLRQVEMSEAIGNHKDAQAILDKAFKSAPHSEWVGIKVSGSKINSGKTEEARKILDKMVEVNNKYAPTYIHMAQIAFSNGDTRESKRLVEKAHELNPYSEYVNKFYPFDPDKMKSFSTH
jgi:tetratricopeptide (TPR) repeat protein